jgi:hypothetical protein
MEARPSRLCAADRRQAEADRGLVPGKSIATCTAASTRLCKTVLSHRDIYTFILITYLRHFSKNTDVMQTGFSIHTVLPAKQRSFRLIVVAGRALRGAKEIYLIYFSDYLMFNEIARFIHLPSSQPISLRSILLIN